MPRTKGARAQYSIDREKKILELLLAGKSDDEIASEVFVSPDYVPQIIRTMKGRVGVKSRKELIEYYQKKNEIAQ